MMAGSLVDIIEYNEQGLLFSPIFLATSILSRLIRIFSTDSNPDSPQLATITLAIPGEPSHVKHHLQPGISVPFESIVFLIPAVIVCSIQ